jgi:hypothetical protein
VSVALHQGVGTINPAATSTTIATLVSVALHRGIVASNPIGITDGLSRRS